MKVDKATMVTSAEIKARKVRKIIRHLKKQPKDEQAMASVVALGGIAVPSGFDQILDDKIHAKNRRLDRSRTKWAAHHEKQQAARKARQIKREKQAHKKPVTTRSKETFTFADLERLLS